MLREVNEAKEFIIKKCGGLENVKPGIYAVPHGDLFMKVVISENMGMSDFGAYSDKALTKKYKRRKSN